MLPMIDVICFIILGIIIGVFIYYSRCLTLCIKEYKHQKQEIDKLQLEYIRISTAYDKDWDRCRKLLADINEAEDEKDDLINQISNL